MGEHDEGFGVSAAFDDAAVGACAEERVIRLARTTEITPTMKSPCRPELHRIRSSGKAKRAG